MRLLKVLAMFQLPRTQWTQQHPCTGLIVYDRTTAQEGSGMHMMWARRARI